MISLQFGSFFSFNSLRAFLQDLAAQISSHAHYIAYRNALGQINSVDEIALCCLSGLMSASTRRVSPVSVDTDLDALTRMECDLAQDKRDAKDIVPETESVHSRQQTARGGAGFQIVARCTVSLTNSESVEAGVEGEEVYSLVSLEGTAYPLSLSKASSGCQLTPSSEVDPEQQQQQCSLSTALVSSPSCNSRFDWHQDMQAPAALAFYASCIRPGNYYQRRASQVKAAYHRSHSSSVFFSR